jgi:hypothetical protein
VVNRNFEREAEQFGEVVRGAIAAAGGTDLVMRAEADLAATVAQVDSMLTGLGVWELQPLEDSTQLQAAASVCHAAGSFALPCPVSERLTAASLVDADAVTVVAGQDRANIPDRALRWMAVNPDGRLSALEPRPHTPGAKLGPFVTGIDLTPTGRYAPELTSLSLVLSGFTLVGMMDEVVARTVEHVRTRVQFGSTLISFQAVQYRLSDAIVAAQMCEELGRYALASLASGAAGALTDAVAFRSETLHAADIVFRAGHQLHGASGFCDETFVSWLSRHSLPLRRLPTNVPATESWLVELIDRFGFEGLFAASGGEESAPSDIGLAPSMAQQVI